MADFDDLGTELEGVETGLDRTTAMAAAFEAQLLDLQGAFQETSRYLGTLEGGISRGLRKAFDGLVLDGMRLSDALGVVARSMIDSAYSAAVKPVTDGLGGLLAQGVNTLVTGMMPFARGAAFSEGRVMPFARGGVVSQATRFPMRGGLGLMGEAGPEAIMPLARGADGRLGVQAQGGGSVHVTMNVSTPDVAGFQRSQGQIAARMARALQRGQRNS